MFHDLSSKEYKDGAKRAAALMKFVEEVNVNGLTSKYKCVLFGVDKCIAH